MNNQIFMDIMKLKQIKYEIQSVEFESEFHKVNTYLKYDPNLIAFQWSCYDEVTFQWACFNGYLPLVVHLLKNKPNINVSANNECAFKYACNNSRLEVANWFCTLNPFKYYKEVNNNKITKWTIFYKTKYNILCLLFCFKFKGFNVSSF